MYNHKESFEDYLEKILELEVTHPLIRAIDIAKAMNYSKPSVSIALKKLKNDELVDINSSTGAIKLTNKGKIIAQRTLEKHNYIKKALIKLGVDENTSDEDACKIEHLLSEKTFEAIKKYVDND